MKRIFIPSLEEENKNFLPHQLNLFFMFKHHAASHKRNMPHQIHHIFDTILYFSLTLNTCRWWCLWGKISKTKLYKNDSLKYPIEPLTSSSKAPWASRVIFTFILSFMTRILSPFLNLFSSMFSRISHVTSSHQITTNFFFFIIIVLR